MVPDMTRQPLPRRLMDSMYHQLETVKDEKIMGHTSQEMEGRDRQFQSIFSGNTPSGGVSVAPDRQILEWHAEAAES